MTGRTDRARIMKVSTPGETQKTPRVESTTCGVLNMIEDRIKMPFPPMAWAEMTPVNTA